MFHTRTASQPILCYVTDRHAFADSAALTAQISRAAAAGIDWIQIREKDMPPRELLAVARAAVKIALDSSRSRTRVIVNDRVDVALAASAAGVHLGENSLPVAAVSQWRGAAQREFLIGASCHSLDVALAAERDGADYILFGPVFATPSKAGFGAPQGVERLAEICGKARIPVLAIGGITPGNVRECLVAGAAGIAAIRMFQEAQDLTELASQLRSAGKISQGGG